MSVWDSNVIAVFLFENNGNDDTTNGFNLATTGTPRFSNIIVKVGNYSYYNVGTRNNNLFSFNSGLNDILYNSGNGTPWTIEFYIYGSYTSGTFIPIICGKGDTLNALGNMVCYMVDNLFVLKHVAPSTTDINISTDASLWKNKWRHVAITNDNAGTLKIYFDGTLVYSRADGNVFKYSDAGFRMLSYPDNSTMTQVNMDNLIISNIARTSFPTLPLPSTTNAGGVYTKGMAFNRLLRNNFGGVK